MLKLISLLCLMTLLVVYAKPVDDDEANPLPLAESSSGSLLEEKDPSQDEDGDEEDEKADVVYGPRNSSEELAEREAEESEKLYEGDILLTEDQEKALKESMDSEKRETVSGKGNARKRIGKKWDQARVPYIVERTFGATRKANLAAAIKEFNEKTCIRFVPKRAGDRKWVKFQKGTGGCNSYIGDLGPSVRDQPINIGDGCDFVGTFIHEMMHAIGFFHEQTRLDRDDHVVILKHNIDTRRYGPNVFNTNFAKYKKGEADTLGEPYDLDSVMHYQNTAFAKKDSRGKPQWTIMSKSNRRRKLGQRDGFSEGDLKQINMMYGCKKFL